VLGAVLYTPLALVVQATGVNEPSWLTSLFIVLWCDAFKLGWQALASALRCLTWMVHRDGVVWQDD
jgi:hypothetical protein